MSVTTVSRAGCSSLHLSVPTASSSWAGLCWTAPAAEAEISQQERSSAGQTLSWTRALQSAGRWMPLMNWTHSSDEPDRLATPAASRQQTCTGFNRYKTNCLHLSSTSVLLSLLTLIQTWTYDLDFQLPAIYGDDPCTCKNQNHRLVSSEDRVQTVG